jgi:hypothetical protein
VKGVEITRKRQNERKNEQRKNCSLSSDSFGALESSLTFQAKYGFIAFTDPEDFLKAWKEMDGKYVGNRPIKLSKIKDDLYGKIDTVSVSGRKVCLSLFSRSSFLHFPYPIPTPCRLI